MDGHLGWADDSLHGRPIRLSSAQAASAFVGRLALLFRWHGLDRLDRIDRLAGQAVRCHERLAPRSWCISATTTGPPEPMSPARAE